MKIGVISDSHDHLDRIRQAVNLFLEEGVGHVLHAGDFVAPFTAQEFARLDCPFTGVYGNNDGERLALQKQFSAFGQLLPVCAKVELEGKRIIVVHEADLVEELSSNRALDLIVYGHSHRSDLREGKPVILNPGEACGWVTGKASVTVVSLEDMAARLVALE